MVIEVGKERLDNADYYRNRYENLILSSSNEDIENTYAFYSYILYRLGDIEGALEKISSFKKYSEGFGFPERTYANILKTMYLYELEEYNTAIITLNSTDPITQNTSFKKEQLNLWKALLHYKLGNFEKAKMYYEDTEKKLIDIERNDKYKLLLAPLDGCFSNASVLEDLRELVSRTR